MKLVDSLTIQGRTIGTNEPTLLVAEISANHDRNLDQAMALVDIVADAGWDCVKFQTYSAESLTVKSMHSSVTVDPIWGADNLLIYTNWRRCQWIFINHFSNGRKRNYYCRLRRFMILKIWILLKI